MAREHAAGMLRELTHYVTDEYTRLMDMWLDLGVPDEGAKDRFEKATNHIRSMVGDLVSGEEEMQRQVFKSIEEYRTTVSSLRSHLSLPPFEVDESLPALTVEEVLREQLGELEHIKLDRLRCHKKLRGMERQYCMKLAMPPHPYVLQDDAIPSQDTLKEIEEHIAMLKKEQERRKRQFGAIRGEILGLVDILGTAPTSASEREIICEDIEHIRLSQEFLSIAKGYLTKLNVEKQEAEEKRAKLVEKVNIYWDRLETSEVYRREFLMEHPGLKVQDIQELEEELERCKALKQERLVQFVEKLRAELCSWYDKCGVPERKEQLEKTGYDDETLDALENELQVMKAFYSTHQQLFTKVERRENLWLKLIALERSAKDPSRFNNRGGALLQEEKQRKQLQKELPKLEKEIHAYIEAQGDDELFALWSQGFNEHVEAQWSVYQQEKENEKQERQRKQQATPVSVRGVKRPGSAAGSVTKSSRLGTTLQNTLRGMTPQLKRSVLRRSKGKGTSKRDMKGTPLHASTSRGQRGTGPKATDVTITSVTSYQEFQEALNSCERAPTSRSTLVAHTYPTKRMALTLANATAKKLTPKRNTHPRQLLF